MAAVRQKWVVGNWKMNGDSNLNRDLVQGLLNDPRVKQFNDAVHIAVCPPSLYLTPVNDLLKLQNGSKIRLGGQDVSAFTNGAHTGQLSASMMMDVGADLVIVGHSERRAECGELDQLIAQKALLALNAGLKPIICMGESQSQRESGQAKTVVVGQLVAALEVLGSKIQNCIVAYEPVWAIGTGLTATSDQVQEMHGWLREALAEKVGELAQSICILYGGSVKPSNAKELFDLPDVDGGLIGGASLVAEDFLSICIAAVS